MSQQIIPLTTAPNQQFNVSLNINSTIVRLTLAINYNEMSNVWILGITDVNGNILLQSIPFVTGDWPAANILGQYQYLNIGAAYILNLNSAFDMPTSGDLGVNFVLLWGDNVP